MTVVVILTLVLFGYLPYQVGGHDDVCTENFVCIPISECKFGVDEGELLYPCKHGKLICCPKPAKQNDHEHRYEPFSGTETNIDDNQVHSTPDDDRILFNKTNSELLDFNITDDKESNLDSDKDKKHNFSWTSTTEYFDRIRINIPDDTTEETAISKTNFTTKVDKNDRINKIPTEEDSNMFSKNHSSSIVTSRPPFQKNCGIAMADNKITGGKVAEPGQFPWMALLGFRQAAVPSIQFLCGGSLITTRHVLTAAHCILKNRPLELVLVRFGEYNLTSPRDCVKFGNDELCADKHVDIQVEGVIIHPEFNVTSLKNDIAIIKIRREVRESDYIKTVCLPFDKDMTNVDLTGQNFTVSGWGKSSSGNLFGSNVLQYAKVRTWNQQKCNDTIPPEVKPLSPTQLCANGPNTEDACKGDSGGPLINTTLDSDAEIRHIQFGIVSFGTATCGDHNLPTIYTRVDKYLNWIVEKVTRGF